jgi:transcriptional regulator with XRE-family HTH domain
MARTTGPRQGGRRKTEEPHPTDIHVGSRVKLRRLELGLSQERLAQELGLTFQQVQKYERGSNRMGASRLYEITQILDTSIKYIFEGRPPSGKSSAASGFAEQAQAAFDSDPLNRRETLDLVEAYYQIDDPGLRRRFLELAKALVSGLSR